MNSNSDWDKMLIEAGKQMLAKQPVKDQVWVMRQSEEANLLRQVLAKKYDLPERVRIIEHQVNWGSTKTFVQDLDKPDGEILDMGGLFEGMYRLYRPTTWEHLEEDSAVPQELPARVEG